MSHKASVETLDRAMRDLRNSNCPIGGCTVLFSGDFRQILPVITRRTRADEVNASLKRSYLWSHITKCEPKTNMRIVLSSKDNRPFSIDLIQIGNGENDFITLNNFVFW
jgi:PIF1 helicase.